MDEIIDLANQYGPILGDRLSMWEFDVRTLKFTVELRRAVITLVRGTNAPHCRTSAGSLTWSFGESYVQYARQQSNLQPAD
jgi:hypothetical protein